MNLEERGPVRNRLRTDDRSCYRTLAEQKRRDGCKRSLELFHFMNTRKCRNKTGMITCKLNVNIVILKKRTIF